jgi:hypothetical protein
MKKSIFLVLLGSAVLCSPAAGWAAPKSAISVQAIGSWFDTGRIEYETALSAGSAIAVRAEFMGKTIDDLYASGIGGGVSYRFYPMEAAQAPGGMFVGPAVDLLSVTASNAGETSSSMFTNLMVEFGYHWFFGESTAFLLSPQLFIGYTIGELSAGGKTADVTGLGYGVGLGLGIAW